MDDYVIQLEVEITMLGQENISTERQFVLTKHDD